MSDKKLAGKTALVTGASGGIGRAIAIDLANAGAEVIVHYAANEEAASEVVEAISNNGGVARKIGGDLRRSTGIALLVGQIEALDILVNNAGVARGTTLAATTEEEFDINFDTNVKATFFLTQALLPKLKDGGSIVNISSTVTIAAQPYTISYAMSKMAINAFTRSLAADLANRKINVNAVLPGATHTNLLSDVINNPGFLETIQAQTAFGRLGTPEEVAKVVTFVASPDAAWVTGQLIQANGGMHL